MQGAVEKSVSNSVGRAVAHGTGVINSAPGLREAQTADASRFTSVTDMICVRTEVSEQTSVARFVTRMTIQCRRNGGSYR